MKQQRPNIEVEDFVKAYKFLRVPAGYLGESFTKGYLLVYFLMRSKETGRLRLYESSYELLLTAKFLKKAYEAVKLKGRMIEIINPAKLAEMIVKWEDENKKFSTKLKIEFNSDAETVMNEILNFQQEARERGWLVLT
jgi:hypothetical protein